MNKLDEDIHDNAVAKGFYDDYYALKMLIVADKDLDETMKQRLILFVKRLWISNRLMLIVSELSEGLEGIRKEINFSSEPKSGGLGEELADADIRIRDLAVSLSIDLEEAVKLKHYFNKGRPIMHGGKAL